MNDHNAADASCYCGHCEVERQRQLPQGNPATDTEHATPLERAVAAEERVAELEKMIRDFLAMLALRGAPYLFADVCHKYGCPATRIGKRSGPCHCGGSALALKWKGLREAMEATRG